MLNNIVIFLRTKLLSVLSNVVKNILESSANNLWDEIWEEFIFTAIEEAEQEWDGGEAKKEKVMGMILNKIDGETKFSKAKRFIVRVFFSSVVNTLVDEVNDKVGKDWIETAESLKEQLADRIDFID